MMNLDIRRLRDSDIPMLENWLSKDYIKKWYHEPEEWLAEVRDRFGKFAFIKHNLVLCDKVPIGFCQYYTCVDAAEDWYGDLPLDGTYSIDYLIGEEAFLGKGLGKAIIELLINEVFSTTDAQRIIVQPELENTPSCKTLLASGFQFDEARGFFIKIR
jgi:RimJ/RimL family protein N-acetyltransferase